MGRVKEYYHEEICSTAQQGSEDHSYCSQAIDYWERRCRAAERIVNESPFVTVEAIIEWQDIKNSEESTYFDKDQAPKIEGNNKPDNDSDLPF